MRYVYLIRSRNTIIDNYRFLKNNSSDVIISTWKDNHVTHDWFDLYYHPNTTWGEGRNELLKIAYNRNLYDYFIFLDDDLKCDFERNIIKLQTFLELKRPNIAYPKINYKSTNGLEYQLKFNCDAAFSCFKRDIVKNLLPYYNGLQEQSWHYSQAIVNVLQTIMYNDSRIQLNSVVYENLLDDSYDVRNNDWDFFIKFMKDLLLDSLHSKIQSPNIEDIPITLINPPITFNYSGDINIDDYLKIGTEYYNNRIKFWDKMV